VRADAIDVYGSWLQDDFAAARSAREFSVMVSTHTRFLAPHLARFAAQFPAPHPKRELLKLCARIGYTPH
jgi:hypothetical protein